jgi:hypothetical protein
LLLAESGGVGVIDTLIIAEVVHPAPSDTTTWYRPLAAGVTLVMIGFCNVDVNAPGPLQV